jgi:hypothetical protein
MGFLILLILGSTIVPSYFISLVIEKTKYGTALGFDNDSGRRKIMIRTYIYFSAVVLFIFFIYNWNELFDSSNYY